MSRASIAYLRNMILLAVGENRECRALDVEDAAGLPAETHPFYRQALAELIESGRIESTSHGRVNRGAISHDETDPIMGTVPVTYLRKKECR